MRGAMRVPVIGALVLLAGCEIGQVTLPEPVSSVVAEVYLQVDDGIPNARAVLHRTFGSDDVPLDGAIIEIRGPNPPAARFGQTEIEECIDGDLPEDFEPACYTLTGPGRFLIRPGATLEVRVVLPDGGRLDGAVTLPSDFRIRRPGSSPGACEMHPNDIVNVTWTQSEGAWAYLPEAEIVGLREAFAAQGITVESEPVTLLGLSISQADTTIAFPSEFGVFNRFSGDREVLVALQQGLPPAEQLWGRVFVSAQERNATNWNRGGIFNPSGQVRVPSLFGDGTGVAAGVVNRSFAFAFHAGEDFPDCGEPG